MRRFEAFVLPAVTMAKKGLLCQEVENKSIKDAIS